jgi:hypothetical protein
VRYWQRERSSGKASDMMIFFVGFLDSFTKASPATQQLMALENKFIAMFPFNRS